VVDPNRRRQGIGSALTRARLEWVFERADSVFYVVNATNRASIDLHAKQGFEEVTRDFDLPGVTFVGGHGVLCRAWAPGAGPRAEIIQFPGRWVGSGR
jgi:GNAT superfamily N-acetyltransferase